MKRACQSTNSILKLFCKKIGVGDNGAILGHILKIKWLPDFQQKKNFSDIAPLKTKNTPKFPQKYGKFQFFFEIEQ